MKLVNSPLCAFCNEDEESLEHLMVQCTHIKTFWQEILNRLKALNIINNKEIFTEFDIIFGLLGSGQENLLIVNLIVIIAKKCIFDCKIRKIAPTWDFLWARIKYFF